MTSIQKEYFLGTIDGTMINDQIKISEEDYVFCLNVLDDFSELIENENLFKVVELNYEDLKSKISEYRLRIHELLHHNSNDFNLLKINVNRLILNLLSAIRTFLDHKETQLKRKFGKKSNELFLFEEEKRSAFDNNFEYRFVSKLRNYAQHCGLPIAPPEIKSFQDENSGVQNEINIFFERNELLSKFDWGVLVRKDLESQPEKFDCWPVIDKVYELFKVINKKINERILENYKSEGNMLLHLIAKTVSSKGMPCLLKSEGTEVITFTVKWFPLDHIAKVTGAQINIVYE
jgi:hypothetical protein